MSRSLASRRELFPVPAAISCAVHVCFLSLAASGAVRSGLVCFSCPFFARLAAGFFLSLPRPAALRSVRVRGCWVRVSCLS